MVSSVHTSNDGADDHSDPHVVFVLENVEQIMFNHDSPVEEIKNNGGDHDPYNALVLHEKAFICWIIWGQLVQSSLLTICERLTLINK